VRRRANCQRSEPISFTTTNSWSRVYMTRTFVTRALMIAGLVFAGATAGFAQNVPVAAKPNRIPLSRVSSQPVAASSVIMSSQGATLSLTADQRAKISTLNTEVAALQSERAKLWAEYRSIISAPNYSDEIAESQAAPRMKRILAINDQLSS